MSAFCSAFRRWRRHAAEGPLIPPTRDLRSGKTWVSLDVFLDSHGKTCVFVDFLPKPQQWGAVASKIGLCFFGGGPSKIGLGDPFDFGFPIA